MKKIRMSVEEWLENAVEIEIENPDDFLKIKETLTRIGIGTVSKVSKNLYQTCHILFKRNRYYIVHFKELLLLDGKPVNFDEFDIQRRNKIASLLEDWGLLEIVDHDKVKDQAKSSEIQVISYANKSDWQLIPKYTIGVKKAVKI